MRTSKRIWIALGLAVVAWGVAAWVVAPALIRQGYEGRSLEIVNARFGGRGDYDVAWYLAKWGRLRTKATIALAAAAVLGLLFSRFRDRIEKPFAPLLARSRPLGALRTLGLAVTVGFAAGLLELLVVLVRMNVSAYPGYWYPTQALWMTPAAMTFAFAVIGAVLAVAGRLLPRLFGLQTVVVALLATALFAFASSAISGLHPAATALVGLGLAARMLPRFTRSEDPLRTVPRRWAPAALVALLAFAAGQTAVQRICESAARSGLPAAPDGAPNVLVVVMDTVRSPSLSLHGYERPTTPGLEELAKESVVFDLAMAPAPWTLPSHASLFTSRLHRDITWARPVPGDAPRLAEELRDRGWVTGGFIANLSFCQEYFGLGRGFVHYEDYPRTPAMLLASSWLTRTFQNRFLADPDIPPVRKTAEQVNDAFLSWLDGVDGAPFFVFLNYMDAHDPYVPPPPWNTKFRDRPGMVRLAPIGHPYTEEQVQQIRDAYDGAIAYLDHEIGRLVDELDARGLLDDTLLIITSDHGEELYEHGIMGHSHSLYWPALHVPLMVRMPGRVPAGRRVGDAVGLQHVPATVADLLGLEDAPFPGPSLAETWDPSRDGGSAFAGPLLAEAIEKTYPQPESYPISHGEMHSILWEGLHYIRAADGSEQLFDVRADPFEQDDLMGAEGMEETIERVRAAFESAESASRPQR